MEQLALTLLAMAGRLFPAVEVEGFSLTEIAEVTAALAAVEPEAKAIVEKVGPVIVKYADKFKVNGQPLSTHIKNIPSGVTTKK